MDNVKQIVFEINDKGLLDNFVVFYRDETDPFMVDFSHTILRAETLFTALKFPLPNNITKIKKGATSETKSVSSGSRTGESYSPKPK